MVRCPPFRLEGHPAGRLDEAVPLRVGRVGPVESSTPGRSSVSSSKTGLYPSRQSPVATVVDQVLHGRRDDAHPLRSRNPRTRPARRGCPRRGEHPGSGRSRRPQAARPLGRPLCPVAPSRRVVPHAETPPYLLLGRASDVIFLAEKPVHRNPDEGVLGDSLAPARRLLPVDTARQRR